MTDTGIRSRALGELRRKLTAAAFRRIWRQTKSPLGAVMALLTVGFIFVGLVPMVAMTFMSDDGLLDVPVARMLPVFLPLMLYVIAAATIALDLGKTLTELQPAELQFVLAGPFSDGQILSYRLATLSLSTLPMSLFFAAFSTPYTGNFFFGLIGIATTISFMMLVGIMRTLATPRISTTTASIVRRTLLLTILWPTVEISHRLLTLAQPVSIESVGRIVQQTWAWKILSIPFRPFGDLIFPGSSFQFGLACATTLFLVGLALVGCYRLNVGFAEIAVEGVARRKQKLERLKGGGLAGAISKPQRATRTIAMLPWLSGFGPIAWLQVTSALRRVGRLLPTLAIVTVAGMFGASFYLERYGETLDEETRIAILPIAMGAAFYASFIFGFANQGGFCAPKRMMPLFQTLPIRPFSLAAGMVTGTTCILWCVRVAVFLPAVVLSSHSWPTSVAILLVGCACDLAFVSSMNFICATTNQRVVASGTPDVFQGIRAMFYMLLVTLVMMPSIIAAAVAVVIAKFTFGFDWGGCAMAAALTVFAFQPLLWSIAGKAFSIRELIDG